MANFSQESGVVAGTPQSIPAYFGGAIVLVPGPNMMTVNIGAKPINTTNGTEAGQYRISYKKVSDAAWTIGPLVPVNSPADASIPAVSVQITGLLGGTQYQFTAAVALTPQSAG